MYPVKMAMMGSNGGGAGVGGRLTRLLNRWRTHTKFFFFLSFVVVGPCATGGTVRCCLASLLTSYLIHIYIYMYIQISCMIIRLKLI